MRVEEVKKKLKSICSAIDESRDYLTQLDQASGDGDLGVSMCDGFHAVNTYADSCDEADIGKFLSKCGDAFNEAAPSSLGTIIAFCFKGMAKSLKGIEDANNEAFAKAFEAGLENIMKRLESKPGQKTILDSLAPAVEALKSDSSTEGYIAAAKAAKAGSDSTKNMKAVWGRAAYYGDNSIGLIDGGSVVGAIIFDAISK